VESSKRSTRTTSRLRAVVDDQDRAVRLRFEVYVAAFG
jgi:hypothetical protein